VITIEDIERKNLLNYFIQATPDANFKFVEFNMKYEIYHHQPSRTVANVKKNQNQNYLETK